MSIAGKKSVETLLMLFHSGMMCYTVSFAQPAASLCALPGNARPFLPFRGLCPAARCPHGSSAAPVLCRQLPRSPPATPSPTARASCRDGTLGSRAGRLARLPLLSVPLAPAARGGQPGAETGARRSAAESRRRGSAHRRRIPARGCISARECGGRRAALGPARPHSRPWPHSRPGGRCLGPAAPPGGACALRPPRRSPASPARPESRGGAGANPASPGLSGAGAAGRSRARRTPTLPERGAVAAAPLHLVPARLGRKEQPRGVRPGACPPSAGSIFAAPAVLAVLCSRASVWGCNDRSRQEFCKALKHLELRATTCALRGAGDEELVFATARRREVSSPRDLS